MKLFYTFFALIFISTLSSYCIGQTVSTTPEILYYKFNGVGTSVINYASAPPLGTAVATINGGITQGAVGSCDGALIGSGISAASDYLNTNWAPNIGNGSWSIVFKTAGFSSTTTLYYIFGDINSNSFRCFTNGVAGANNWIIRGGGITDTYINGGATASETTCAFVYDSPANVLRGYLNGVLVSTVAQSVVNISGIGPLKVMGYSTNVGAPQGGLMEEFRLYSHALTSPEVLQLYLNQSFDTISVSSCGNYTAPSGAVFNATGIYNDTIANSLCGDSIIQVDLTILNATSSIINQVACDTYTAPSGAVFTASGLYNDTILNALGCDSIISIDLVINNTTTDTITITECNSYTSPIGTLISASGIYDFVLPNSIGCDSLIHLDLTILNTSSSTINQVACGFYTAPSGAVYTLSGIYNDTILSSLGCDSVISINLTINSVNNNVTVNGSTINASAMNATYQWIDCGSGLMIPNETNDSYMPISNGSYAVIVSENNCVDTSTCVTITTIGISENLLLSNFNVYPNPTDGNLMVYFTEAQELISVSVFTIEGKLLMDKTMENTQDVSLQISEPAGLYLLKLRNQTGQVATVRIVKQ